MGRKEEAKKELDAAAKASSDNGKQSEGSSVPSPELLQDSR